MKTMKNAVLIIALAAAMILLACCSPAAQGSNEGAAVTDGVYDSTEPTTPDIVSDAAGQPDPGKKSYRIVSIGDGALGSDAGPVGLIRLTETSTEAEFVGSVKTFEFAGKTYELEYENTIYYVLGDYSLDRYSVISGGEDLKGSPAVGFLRSGEVVSVSMRSAFRMDIGEEATDEQILSAAEDCFADMFDFAGYGYKQVDHIDDLNNYQLRWYNKRGEFFLDDSLTIRIGMDGEFIQFINKKASAADPGDLPEDLELEGVFAEIEAILGETYNDPSESYVVEKDNCKLTVVEGKTAIHVFAERYDSAGYLLEKPEFAVIIDG